MLTSIFSFVVYSVFGYWVVFLDGAEQLEGWKSIFFFGWTAPGWSTREIRFCVAISWIAGLIVLIVRLFSR